jgi:hypothetical protein
MNYEWRDNWLRVGFRVLIASPFFLLGGYFLVANPAYLFVAYGLFLVAALFIATAVARLASDWLHAQLWPTDSESPPPVYGIPESHVQNGLYEQAMIEYEAIAARHPDEIKPYADMIEIAILRLRDRARARAIFESGLARLRGPDRQRALRTMYEAISSRLDTIEERSRNQVDLAHPHPPA